MEKPKVFYIDDLFANIESMTERFKDSKFNFVARQFPGEMWEELEQFKPEIILCDFIMGKENGIIVLKKIKSMYPNTVRMIITAQPDLTVSQKEIEEAGIFKFISKNENKKLLLYLDEAVSRYQELFKNRNTEEKKNEDEFISENTILKENISRIEDKRDRAFIEYKNKINEILKENNELKNKLKSFNEKNNEILKNYNNKIKFLENEINKSKTDSVYTKNSSDKLIDENKQLQKLNEELQTKNNQLEYSFRKLKSTNESLEEALYAQKEKKTKPI